MQIDPILSVLVAAIIAFGGVRLIRQTGHILIEGVPPGLSLEAIKEDLASEIPGAETVQHLHAWALNETQTLLTLEIVAAPDADLDTIRAAAKQRLADRFGLTHTTIEVCRNGSESPATQGCRP